MNTHLAAYWLGRIEALLDAHDANEIKIPGIIRESFEGQRDHWRELLDNAGIDRHAFRKS